MMTYQLGTVLPPLVPPAENDQGHVSSRSQARPGDWAPVIAAVAAALAADRLTLHQ